MAPPPPPPIPAKKQPWEYSQNKNTIRARKRLARIPLRQKVAEQAIASDKKAIARVAQIRSSTRSFKAMSPEERAVTLQEVADKVMSRRTKSKRDYASKMKDFDEKHPEHAPGYESPESQSGSPPAEEVVSAGAMNLDPALTNGSFNPSGASAGTPPVSPVSMDFSLNNTALDNVAGPYEAAPPMDMAPLQPYVGQQQPADNYAAPDLFAQGGVPPYEHGPYDNGGLEYHGQAPHQPDVLQFLNDPQPDHNMIDPRIQAELADVQEKLRDLQLFKADAMKTLGAVNGGAAGDRFRPYDINELIDEDRVDSEGLFVSDQYTTAAKRQAPGQDLSLGHHHQNTGMNGASNAYNLSVGDASALAPGGNPAIGQKIRNIKQSLQVMVNAASSIVDALNGLDTDIQMLQEPANMEFTLNADL